MSAPWMKFYPSDWRADPKLRMCSIGARGLWVEMLCVMHEAEPYGYLVSNGRAVTSRQMAALAGISAGECMKYLLELVSAGVYSIDENKRIYSRRMVRDKEKAERDRENGKGGGNPKLKGLVKVGVNPPDKAQIPEARSHIPETDSRPVSDRAEKVSRFDEFWKAYPRRKGDNPRKTAETKFNALVKGGTDPQMLIDAIKKYAIDTGDKVGTEYMPMAQTWLNQQRWSDHAAVAFMASEVSPEQQIDAAVKVWAKMPGVWSKWAGPAPGDPGCRASIELLAKYGLDIDGRKLEPAGVD